MDDVHRVKEKEKDHIVADFAELPDEQREIEDLEQNVLSLESGVKVSKRVCSNMWPKITMRNARRWSGVLSVRGGLKGQGCYGYEPRHLYGGNGGR